MTGTVESLAKPTTSEWGPTRATIQQVMLEMTRDVSYKDSFTPSWISSFPRNMGCPPSLMTAASVDTRVRVERLLNIIATAWPLNFALRAKGTSPALRAVLWEEALRTRWVSSVGVRSAMERKWRGEALGVAGVEYARREALESCCRAALAGRSCVDGGILILVN